jgi:hypothetical protein
LPAVRFVVLVVYNTVAFSPSLRNAVARVVAHLAPEFVLPDPFLFDVARNGAFLHVSTNINFSALNEIYHKHVDPHHSTLTAQYLLSIFHQATAELQTAALAKSEMALSQVSTLVADTRLNEVLRPRLGSERVLQIFQEFVFDDARAIREAINTCHKNMAELTKLVEQAQKFKNWIRGQPEDQDIRKAYCSAISKLGWCEGLPSRSRALSLLRQNGLRRGRLVPAHHSGP